MKKRYDLIIVTGTPFPKGGVMVNRIMSYATELVALGKSVLVVSKHRTIFYGDEHVDTSGTINGVDYEYLMPAWRKKKTGLFKRAIFDRIERVFRLYYFFLFKYRCKSFQYYSRETDDALRLRLIAYITRSGLYREISEAPLYISNKIKRYIDTQYCRLYDGMVMMTDGIRQYFHFIPDSKTFILPMSVDTKRFEIDTCAQENYFFYCSGGNLERDGLMDSINAFIIFSKDHPNYYFHIATTFDLKKSYDQEVKCLIDNNEKIKYLGMLPIEEIPIRMLKSIGLMITPHIDYLTKGFPTKLGEYLASGRPVICTSIATLKKCIPCNCVYMVAPNSPQQIADKLSYIISHQEESAMIGCNGLNFVKEHYTVKPYAHKLCQFLKLD